MTRPAQTTFKLPGRELTIGPLPRVVGVLSSLPADFTSPAAKIPCDLVEVRLDQMPGQQDWLARSQAIEARGVPVLLTIRLESEGGKWALPDQDRLKLFQEGLRCLAAVDVEFRSPLAPLVSGSARDAGKGCIVSFHDFSQTPPLSELRAVVENAQKIGTIVKMSTLIKSEADVRTLKDLLLIRWETPLCVIGMGPLGTATRLSFATLGSCLTYGYLDRPSAPGQLSASEMVQKLRELLPAYKRDFDLRKQAMAYA